MKLPLWLIPSLVCALIPLVGISGAEASAVGPDGSQSTLWLVLLFMVGAMLAVPIFLIALVGLLFLRTRRFAGVVALCSVVYCVALVAAVGIAEHIRMGAFARLAERSKSLIAAIRAHEQKYGRPPESLDALVPEFIPKVPSTGMGAYRFYEYSTSTNSDHDNPWVLSIPTPSGGINFDQFIYFPRTNYPSTGYGGRLERVGDWAYVHE